MIEADPADYNRAKLDHDLIVAITSHILLQAHWIMSSHKVS